MWDNEDYETIKNFINQNVTPKDPIALVTDNGTNYEKIMKELNIFNTISCQIIKNTLNSL